MVELKQELVITKLEVGTNAIDVVGVFVEAFKACSGLFRVGLLMRPLRNKQPIGQSCGVVRALRKLTS